MMDMRISSTTRKKKSKNVKDKFPRKDVNTRNKQKVKKQGHFKNQKSSGTYKLTVDDVRKKLRTEGDRTEENLRQLQLLGGTDFDRETAYKIFDRAVKNTREEKEKPMEDSTVFTEEDFENFEKEYFVN